MESFVDKWIAEREDLQRAQEQIEIERQEAAARYKAVWNEQEKREALAQLATTDWLTKHGQDGQKQTTS